MIFLNVPLLMVVAFLLLTLAVGLYYSRKTTTLREYTVGNKQFATATLVATVLATNYGAGGLVRSVQQVHHLGLYYIIYSLLANLDYWIIIRPLALRMTPFMQNLSMAETIGSVYGKYPRVITALACIGASIAGLAIQITVISQVISICCIDAVNPKPKYITILATLILIFYSSFGGIRAVTFTDVLQFITFSIIIPFLAIWMFYKINNPVAESISFLQAQEKFQFKTLLRFDTKLVAIMSLILSGMAAGINPTMVQRIYMSSGPIQAQKVFLYSGLFSWLIKIIIILIGLFVFVQVPELSIEAIWPYIMKNISSFSQGLVSISLLAMAMSTADSKLNACAVMVSHDILESIRGVKRVPYTHQLRLARLTSLVIGLCAMVLAFYRKDLFNLLKLIFAFTVPIITAPFVLAILGFRGSGRTALIGMATGIVTIIAWNQWIEPTTGIDGAFVSMLANGLAMLAAHYSLPQLPGTGWIEPDDELKQIRQAHTRKWARRKEACKALFSKDNLANLQPTTVRLVGVSLYVITTAFVDRFIMGVMHPTYWPIFQIMVGACFAGYGIFIPKNKFPSWLVARYWLIGLAFCFPVNSIWHFWHATDSLLTLTLTLVHLSITLWVLPLYLGLLVGIPLIIVYAICCIKALWLWGTMSLLLLGIGLLICVIIIFDKFRNNSYENQNTYLKNQQKLRETQKLKSLAYNLHMDTTPVISQEEEDGMILEKVVKDVTQSVSFIDDTTPLYKQDFQSIINKFSEWAIFLKQQAKSKDHILLLPTAISINQLINKIEVALEREMENGPRLFIEHKDNTVPVKIVCDVNQIIHLLVTAILRTAKSDVLETQFVRVYLYTTHLQYEVHEPIDNGYAPAMVFSAIAFVISSSHLPLAELPKVQSYYEPNRDNKETSKQTAYRPLAQTHIDLGKKTIERIMHTHYGYLEISNQGAILLVLPWDVTKIREEMIAKLPITHLTSEAPITPKEQADSMMVLMQFHEYVCQVAEVDPGMIAEILLLLRRCYGFKRHASGQLFYVRAVGIAQWVATWIFHSPKPIYASLLYDLVRYTRLPLSYIKANYNRGIFCFVENVLNIDQHQEMAKSLLYVTNRFKEAINQDHLSVLYIKLAERLYDLRYAKNYNNLEAVRQMAKETLTVDIELAKKYLESEIAKELETAAKQALAFCNAAVQAD
ncbi:sodium:solute symporter family transporter [Candidatus Cardinium hertigii]|nr:HD domain-containing protein [Candidatus Cardinium hertigii]